ncbi:aminoacyl-tRNA deacylase [Globicatella sulfidifaciens]|uniref:Cys-tRNA(Pro)/Cys-tRNA(Cys) deacylase n=1 Tax=Globicatella sulfidifaciens DSM 15739 TaxID=1121925 RepID=A0A1T4KEF9_9LACT|nr:aminoacyl-tRNA deacylase [Globicatella sulfidifaciens]SJZ40848.1 Cys-tRNA(Pro)/Cys-tRNA(Cys) deacylase [Globicatella sulfidifaciens DSM 15739]
MSKQHKTNVMRLLEQHQIAYQPHEFTNKKASSELPIYKTLVTVAKSKAHYVFVVPVTHELDLKKAAKAVNEKSIEMIKEKELLPLTGYVHGGCSPIGMKKSFYTTFDQSIDNHTSILFSAGKVGFSVEIAVSDLEQLNQMIDMQKAEVAKEK